MANCNCNDFPISCAPHAPGGDCCHPHGCPPHPHPCPPPPFKGGTSMYIGARYVPIFADPVEWDDEREYEPLTIVTHNGDCYTSKCYVPKGAQLPPYPEGQTKYWVKTSDYNGQFADLKKTVLDLSRLVEQFQKDNKEFTDLINGWNEKVQQWENEMTAWGERLDTVESHVTDLTASLNAEIDRAKAAEQANAAAIAKETTDRQQAISELDAAYKAADDAEAQKREEADTALSNRITANKTDIDAIKAEQVIQNTNITNNAKNISDNSAEIAKHAARLTSLESNASDWDDVFPDTTIAQEIQKEENARANADTALNGRCDAIAADVEEVRDIANHKVDQTVFQEADALNVKYTDPTKPGIIIASTLALTPADQINREWLNDNQVLTSYQGNKDLYAKTALSQFALKFEVDTAQAAADKANTTIGDWDTDHPNQTISQCATSVENEIAAVDAKADANAANIGDWNTEHPGKTISQAVTDVSSAIPDVSGFVTETTYNQGQAAQNTKITAAQAAADKANTNIGDWENDHPGQTISQNAANLKNEQNSQSARIAALEGAPGPDLSGYVTTSTYTEGQNAQDTKITAAQAAADKANASIGDWDAQHPGQTIAQIDVRTYLDELYPADTVISGLTIASDTIFTQYYHSEQIGNKDVFLFPITVPELYEVYPSAWNVVTIPPSYVILTNVNTGTSTQKTVLTMNIQNLVNGYAIRIAVSSAFNLTTEGVYYIRLAGPNIAFYFKKNAVKFSQFPLPGDDT